MKKNFKEYVKKAVAVVAMAAAVVTVVPVGSAEAACAHRYHKVCIGYETHCTYTHTYTSTNYIFFIPYTRSIDCTCSVVYHGDSTQCVDCGVPSALGTHHGATIHQDCPCSEYPCDGRGSIVASLY